MVEPEKYRDVLVRVGSYCAYFTELTEEQQIDIIKRTSSKAGSAQGSEHGPEVVLSAARRLGW